MSTGASDSIYTHLTYGPQGVIYTGNKSQISRKIPAFLLPFCTGNGIMCCKEQHPLLVRCLIAFIGCIKMAGRAFSSIHKPVMVNPAASL